MGDDSDLMKWIHMLQVVVEKSMSCLMVGCSPLLFFRHEDTLLGNAQKDLVPGFLKVLHIHNGFITSCSKESGFVHKVGQICTTCSRSSPCYSGKIHIFTKFYFSCMYSQDIESFLDIWKSYSNLTVESTRSQ